VAIRQGVLVWGWIFLFMDPSFGQTQDQTQVPQPTQKIQEELVPEFHREKKRFVLNLKDAKLREVLLLLTKDTGTNLIVDPAVDGTISALDLKDVTLEEALEAILPGLGLEYHLSGNMLRVNRPTLQTRIFYLNYIAANRTGNRQMRLTSRSQTGGSGGVEMAGGGAGTSSASGSGGSGGSGQSGGSQSENESSINTANSSRVWMDIRDGLAVILFPGSPVAPAGAATGATDRGPEGFAQSDVNGRRLLINPQAGMIMLHAESDLIDEAARFLEAVEGSVQRQVLIEAKIIEVTLNKDYQLGVNWAAVLNPSVAFTGLLPTVLGVPNPSTGLSLGQPINQNVNPSLGSFQYGISNSKVGVLIDALSRQGQLKVLSSPRVSTLNNQKAVIRVVREEVFFTQSSLASLSLGGNVTTQNIINQIVPIGVVMEIIPQVGSNGDITLSVNPSISELVEVKTFATSSGAAVSTQPVIDRRDLDTVAKVKSGQSLLIAGIMRERRAEDLRGVPWLMNLPVLGGAFRRTEQSSQRTELVILITPTILVGKRMEDLTQEAQEQIQKMEKKFKLGTVDSFKDGMKGELNSR
jgi:MSHA biogenesis protein MshL